MRKFLSLVLCAFFLFNVSGYYVIFRLMQYHARKEMKAYIKNNLSDDEMEMVIVSDSEISSPLSSFKFVKKNEFTYKGKLYDIVRRKKDGDNTIFYCINDKQEEKLFAGLNEHIKWNTDNNAPSKSRSVQLLKNIVKEALPENALLLCSNQQNFNIHFNYDSFLKTQFIPILFPPPKV